MTTRSEAVRAALAHRLTAVLETLGIDSVGGASDAETAARALVRLVDHLRESQSRDIAWLVFVAASTIYPDESLLSSVLERLRALGSQEFAEWLLDTAVSWGERSGDLGIELEIVRDAVVIDVSFAATNSHNSGIQRVVRSAGPHWAGEQGVVLAAHLGPTGALRSLITSEYDRVARWGLAPSTQLASESRLIVPWGSKILFPEVPSESRLEGLAVLASLERVVAVVIGHDAIPLVGREYVSRREAQRFSVFLHMLKHVGLVIGVSAAAGREFRGLLGTVGWADVPVVARALPIIADRPAPVTTQSSLRPLVLVVGSKEPRKNQDAVLFASELLWREGLDFDLLLVGTYGWSTRRFRSWLRRLRSSGRNVQAPAKFGDDALWHAYSRAAFTVFPSLHEGFGLPIAESLSYGVPCITSDHGSMAEIADGGGCILVDPRDDSEIVAAMRVLLTDPLERERLATEARARPRDSWRRYAEETLALVRQL
jgi:glycosyltransferase involved in cell wall biosynthesis